jgi:hypothetical protein
MDAMKALETETQLMNTRLGIHYRVIGLFGWLQTPVRSGPEQQEPKLQLPKGPSPTFCRPLNLVSGTLAGPQHQGRKGSSSS